MKPVRLRVHTPLRPGGHHAHDRRPCRTPRVPQPSRLPKSVQKPWNAWARGFSEFDRVLGGGVVPGSVTLIAGEPGIGKSTLLLQTAGNIARTVAEGQTINAAGRGQSSHRPSGLASTRAHTVLYISGEESQAQVRLRATRINAVEPNLLLAATTDLATVLGLIEQNKPALAIVDSAQTIVSQEVDGISGGSTQVREVASA